MKSEHLRKKRNVTHLPNEMPDLDSLQTHSLLKYYSCVLNLKPALVCTMKSTHRLKSVLQEQPHTARLKKKGGALSVASPALSRVVSCCCPTECDQIQGQRSQETSELLEIPRTGLQTNFIEMLISTFSSPIPKLPAPGLWKAVEVYWVGQSTHLT